MPELPEVETSRRGISPHIVGKRLKGLIIRQTRLRWPIPENLATLLTEQTLTGIQRRGKYLLLAFGQGHVLLHLGMSGSLRIASLADAPGKHDHIDWLFADGTVLRYNDPRKFGAVLWTTCPEQHPLLVDLGPEPLTAAFNGDHLFQRSRKQRIPIKSFIMDNHIVVGVGNIYANESLFKTGLHPNREAASIDASTYTQLADNIRQVLDSAITQGGTTLRDYVNPQGKPGYFQQTLNVYGRRGQPCRCCGALIEQIKIGQRASYFCPHCQS